MNPNFLNTNQNLFSCQRSSEQIAENTFSQQPLNLPLSESHTHRIIQNLVSTLTLELDANKSLDDKMRNIEMLLTSATSNQNTCIKLNLLEAALQLGLRDQKHPSSCQFAYATLVSISLEKIAEQFPSGFIDSINRMQMNYTSDLIFYHLKFARRFLILYPKNNPLPFHKDSEKNYELLDNYFRKPNLENHYKAFFVLEKQAFKLLNINHSTYPKFFFYTNYHLIPYHDAWVAARKNGNLDLQRTILLLVEPPGFNINADERKKVTDPAIKQVLKEIPYFSRQRASLEHLNGVVNFADPLYSEKKIVCRHLSTHRILNMANHKMGKYRPIPSNNTINALLDENSVRENVHYFIEKQYQKIKINPIEVHLVKNSSFGKALIHQFQTMINNIKKAAEPNKKDEAVRYIILESLNHSMSLRLCIKRNPEGTDYYVVEFFDPNMTVNHIRVSNTVLNNLKLFTLRDLFFQINTKTSYYNIYYPEGNQFSILNVTGTAQETLNSLKKNNSKKPNLTSGGDLENSIEKISYLIIDGFHENLIELANELKEKIKKNEINPNEITRIIGLEVSDGCPILYTAMLQGNTNIIKAYGELLKLIPANTRASFLAAKGPEGFPSFLIATAMGHTELIKAFGQLLILIPECDSINLLFPKNFEENSVISTALRNNKTEAAVAWGEVILKTIKNKEVHLDFQKKVHEFYSPSNNSNQNTMTPERRIDYQRILSSVEEKRPSSLLHSETPNKKPKT